MGAVERELREIAAGAGPRAGAAPGVAVPVLPTPVSAPQRRTRGSFSFGALFPLRQERGKIPLARAAVESASETALFTKTVLSYTSG